MKTIMNLLTSLIITSICNMESLISLITRIINVSKETNIQVQNIAMSNQQHSDLLRIAGILITFILSFYIIYQLRKVRDSFKISSIVLYKKSRDLKYGKELLTKEQKDEHTKYLVNEFINTRNMVHNNFKHFSLNKINKIMFEMYPDEVKNEIQRKK